MSVFPKAPAVHSAFGVVFTIEVQTREDKGDREGIPHTHPIPQVIRLELFLRPQIPRGVREQPMAKDAESDIAIRFVDENDYREISAKAVSAKRKLKKKSPFLSCIELTVQ